MCENCFVKLDKIIMFELAWAAVITFFLLFVRFDDETGGSSSEKERFAR